MPQQFVDILYFDREVERLREYEIGLVYKWLFPECLASWFHAPLTPRTFRCRIKKTLKHYEGTRTLTNLEWRNALHLMGIVLNKS